MIVTIKAVESRPDYRTAKKKRGDRSGKAEAARRAGGEIECTIVISVFT